MSDIKSHTVKVTPFEIGSHTGYISTENRRSIHSLHKFCENNITLKKFIQNLSAITVLSSYFIFNARNQENWESLETIHAPFKNNWNQWNKSIHPVQETITIPAGGFGNSFVFSLTFLWGFFILLYYIENPINKDDIVVGKQTTHVCQLLWQFGR